MRVHWKLLSSAGIAAAILVVLIFRSRDVEGDTPDASSPQQPAPPPPGFEQDPTKQYELGPHAIRYEEQSPEEQANLDRMGEATSTAQGAGSHHAFARAADQAAERARAEIAAAQLGLTGTEDQGVVP